MSKNNEQQEKLKQIIELLKVAHSLDDKEILNSTINAIIEMLEEINN